MLERTHLNQRVMISIAKITIISPPNPYKTRPRIIPAWLRTLTESANINCPTITFISVNNRANFSPKRCTSGPDKRGRIVFGAAYAVYSADMRKAYFESGRLRYASNGVESEAGKS